MNNKFKLVVAALAATSLLAACGQAPEETATTSTPTPSGDSTASETAEPSETATSTVVDGFLPCIVSDAGGFDDKSFNQSSHEGLEAAAAALDIDFKAVQSDTEDQYAGNITSLIDQGCTLVITVGFLLADATKAAAEANPTVDFVILDDSSIDLPNVKSVIFDTAEAAFLAGYAAASYTTTGTVGTWGGMQIPTVTIFMDGFVDGVNYYNEQKSASVKVVGWDVASQQGSFTGGFEANNTAKELANTIIGQDADVLLPVGGPIFISAVEAIQDSGKDLALIGVDADLYETADTGNDLFLTSILKQMKSGVENIVTDAAAGEFDSSAYVGTLENDGVGIAPFHEFESSVDPSLAAELEEIKAGIIAGTIEVESPSRPAR